MFLHLISSQINTIQNKNKDKKYKKFYMICTCIKISDMAKILEEA